jgi:hypothetical protein
MSRFFQKLVLFIMVPLLIGEITARFVISGNWYEQWNQSQVVPAIHQTGPCVLLSGSSRMGSAIEESVFDSAMLRLGGKKEVAYNLGLGYAYPATWYLILKRIAEQRTGHLSECLVLVEAPSGLPPGDTWESSWVKLSICGPVVMFIEPDDNASFLLSRTPLGDKLLVLFSEVFKSAELIKRFRDKLYQSASGSSLLGQATGGNRLVDLSTKAGARNDAYGVELVRQEIMKAAITESREQHEITEQDWEKSVLKSIVTLVRSQGGEVMLLNIPISSLEGQPLHTRQREIDRKTFNRVASKWKLKTLQVPLSYNDDDFPDLLHLSHTRSKQFAIDTARAILALPTEDVQPSNQARRADLYKDK